MFQLGRPNFPETAMRSLLLWADGNPGAATGKFTPRGLPLKGVGRFEISLLPRCRHCLNVINKTRQARNGARPCANGAVALIRFSRFSVRRGRLAGGGLFGTSLYVCFRGDVRGSVLDGRRSPSPSYLSSNATLHSSKGLVSSDLFPSPSSSNATELFDPSGKAPPAPASS